MLDFDPEVQVARNSEEDFFDPLEYPVKKRSLSNGDSFFPKQNDNAAPTKLAVTASDPDSSG